MLNTFFFSLQLSSVGKTRDFRVNTDSPAFALNTTASFLTEKLSGVYSLLCVRACLQCGVCVWVCADVGEWVCVCVWVFRLLCCVCFLFVCQLIHVYQ